jgi:hypothetical protein
MRCDEDDGQKLACCPNEFAEPSQNPDFEENDNRNYSTTQSQIWFASALFASALFAFILELYQPE